MKIFAVALVATFVSVPALAVDTTVYNSAPAQDWHFGTGNDYAPSNSAVLTTTGEDELALRMHQTFQPAPASDANGVYSFALGTSPISFDWSIDSSAMYSALITFSNVGTGFAISYDPFFVGNDNAILNNSVQNSFRLDCFGNPACTGLFTPNLDSTYKVNLTVNGLAGGTRSLDVFAQVGAGAGVVPEPESWAMLLLGFGLVGGVMRSRSRRTAVSRPAIA